MIYDIGAVKKAIVRDMEQQEGLDCVGYNFPYKGQNISIGGELDLGRVVDVCRKTLEIPALKELTAAQEENDKLRRVLQKVDNFIADKGFSPTHLLKEIDQALNETTVE